MPCSATSSSPSPARRHRFRGQRVIEQTIREKLPEGFQRAEYLLEHGMIDMVVHRGELRDRLRLLISYLMPEEKAAA